MLCTHKRNIILKNTQDWMEGKLTVYMVAKEANCKWETAQKYLNQFAPMIKAKETEMLNKLTNPEETNEGKGIWQRIKRRILSRIVMAQ